MKLYNITYIFFLCVVGITGLFFIATMIPIPGNFEVRVVQSGSMEPAIHTGSVVVIKPSSEYGVGDIITFSDPTNNTPTTHRIVALGTTAEDTFVTKGDANDGNDMGEISKERIMGKVVASIPFVGYLLDAGKKPIGFALLVVLPALIIISEEFSKIVKEIKKTKAKKEEKPEIVPSDTEQT